MRTAPIILATALGLCVSQSKTGLADTITNYQLSGVTFTSGQNTWDMTGSFTYDDFNNGGGGTESNVSFTIAGPSVAFTGTYTQIASVPNSGNGFTALGTRTDGSPAGFPYDVVLTLDSPSQVGDPHTALVNLITFVVPGNGNFAGFENVTGEVIASPAATPLPPSWSFMLMGLIGAGVIYLRRNSAMTVTVEH